MRMICISDTHNGHKSLRLPEGNVLIHAGDATGQGLHLEVERFLAWFASQPHQHKILIAGNHDWLFQRNREKAAKLLAAHPGITYLQDSGVVIEGIRFWGSPWQPWFRDWAFNLPRHGLLIRNIWSKIPTGTDVLITHGPPHGVLDQVHGGLHLGCEDLRNRLAAVRPRVHIFGHIHDSYGVAQSKKTIFVNACACDEQYRMRNQPIVLDLDLKGVKALQTEPNERLMSLTQLQASLEHATDDSREEVSFEALSRHLAGLRELASLRGVRTEALLQEYIGRGLQADLAKLCRAESKPSKRPIPFIRLENYPDGG